MNTNDDVDTRTSLLERTNATLEDVRKVLGHHTLCVTLDQSLHAKILETESLAHCDCGT